MKSFIKNLFTVEKLKSAVIQILLFAVAFNLLMAFMETTLLPTDRELAAPSLTLPTLDGQIVEHHSLLGKPTVVYFFAPWCQVCHLSIGNLENLYQDKQEDINVVAVALSYDSKNAVAEFVGDKALTFPVLLGTNELMGEYRVDAFPTYYVLDSQGRIVSRSRGYSTELGLRLRTL